MIVVEVLSPSTGRFDTGTKLGDYFRLASLCHYLIVDLKRRCVIHHRRDGAGTIATQVVREGAITLDPPGPMLGVTAPFG